MHYHVYCDESSIERQHSYTVYSGLLVGAQRAARLKESIGEWRLRSNMLRELKWSKVTRQKYKEYSQFVSGALWYIEGKELAFRSLVLPKKGLDYKLHHDGDKELAYHKFMFQLLFHTHCKIITPGDTLTVFLDDHQTRYDICDLKDVLNTAMRSKLGFDEDPIRRIEAIDSKGSDFMQMNDLLLGAVAYDNNRRAGLAGARAEKMAIVKLIADKMGLSDLRVQTPRSMTHFGVWKFKFNSQ